MAMIVSVILLTVESIEAAEENEGKVA